MPLAHASPDLLAGHAAGALSEGMTLLVACHLALCPECRARSLRLEAIGGALLAAADSAPMAEDALGAALARIDRLEAATRGGAAAPEDARLPQPLLERLGGGADDIRWRFLLPGLSEHRLAGFEGEDVRLLRARPGVRILQHTHVGDEATLVLAGALSDGGRTYRRGDMTLRGAEDDHHPEIVGDEVCICLIALTGHMHFTGRIGRALNLFSGGSGGSGGGRR